MLTFLTSALGLSVIGFYVYIAVAFFRRVGHDYPAWGLGKRLTFSLTWPATVWDSPNNPAR